MPRRPRPHATAILEGARARDLRRYVGNPIPEQASPKCPSTFTDEQRTLWNRIVEVLDRDGLARRADEQRLIGYVFAEWMVADCTRRINDTGLLVRGRNGEPKANPLLAIRHRADATATKLGAEFGLTPSSRRRLLPHLPEQSLT